MREKLREEGDGKKQQKVITSFDQRIIDFRANLLQQQAAIDEELLSSEEITQEQIEDVIKTAVKSGLSDDEVALNIMTDKRNTLLAAKLFGNNSTFEAQYTYWLIKIDKYRHKH